MKSKKLKKLTLTKETIANLSKASMQDLQGGVRSDACVITNHGTNCNSQDACWPTAPCASQPNCLTSVGCI